MSLPALRGRPDVVARRLLGAHLVAGDVVVRLVEVEAYGGAADPASHAFKGERVANRTMFGPPGHLYVYVSYGIHHCANITCDSTPGPGAVLLRAADVLAGGDLVLERRGRSDRGGRLGGPGILCQALGISIDDDGTDVLAADARVRLVLGAKRRTETVVAGPRVGITKAVERPWRFRLVNRPVGALVGSPRGR